MSRLFSREITMRMVTVGSMVTAALALAAVLTIFPGFAADEAAAPPQQPPNPSLDVIESKLDAIESKLDTLPDTIGGEHSRLIEILAKIEVKLDRLCPPGTECP